MKEPSPPLPDPELTARLRACSKGDRNAFDELVPLVYDQLRIIARAQLRRQPQQTLDTTGLVHETYLKLAVGDGDEWQDRSHFFAASAQAMRHILVDAARRRLSQKRGAGEKPLSLSGHDVQDARAHAEEVLAVHQALEKIRAVDEQMAQVVECRFFGGYPAKETAMALGISDRTERRLWTRAKGWLRWHLDSDQESAGDTRS